jgi:DHA1 family bicyclomycin/chloramphenicol resistance-like MFS transporter
VSKTRPPRLLLYAIAAIVGIGSFSISIYLPALEDVSTSLGASQAAVQRSYSVFFLGYGLAQLIYGPVSDMFGRKSVLTAGLSVYGLGCLVCMNATSIETLIAGRLIQGLGVCVGPTVGRAICRDVFDGKELAKALSLISALIAISPAIAPTLGGVLTEYGGWKTTFVFLFLVSLILIIISWMYLFETNNEQRSPPSLALLVDSFRSICSNGQFLSYSITGGLVLAAWFVYVSSASFIYGGFYGFGPAAVGTFSLFPTAGYFLGSLLSAKLAGRVRNRKVATLGTLLAALGSMAMITAGPTYLGLWALWLRSSSLA